MIWPKLVIESGVLSAEHILNVLARLNATGVAPSVESSLVLKELPLANTGRYDSLRYVLGGAVCGVASGVSDSVGSISNGADTAKEIAHVS